MVAKVDHNEAIVGQNAIIMENNRSSSTLLLEGVPPLQFLSAQPLVSSMFLNTSIETITYCLNGSFGHEDFAGKKRRIETGGLQFMTAGCRIMRGSNNHPLNLRFYQ